MACTPAVQQHWRPGARSTWWCHFPGAAPPPRLRLLRPPRSSSNAGQAAAATAAQPGAATTTGSSGGAQAPSGGSAGAGGPTAAAVAATVAAAAAAAPAAKSPSELQLGADIPIKLCSVTVAGATFLLVVPDIDVVMELYIAAGQTDRDPYWCEPWPSALAMSEQLLTRPDLVAGRRVGELGCGLGLAGLAAALAGAAEVVLLDREPLALQCALLNAALNGLPTAAGAAAGSSSVPPPSLEQLLPHLSPEDTQRLAEHQRLIGAQRQQHGAGAAAAGAVDAAAAVAPAAAAAAPAAPAAPAAAPGRVRAECFDWSAPVTLAPLDVMLVCDCLYEAFSVQPVAAVAPKLLRRDGSRLLLADPPERARHNRECFLDILCEESGDFLVEEATEAGVKTWEASQGAHRHVPVALMHLRRAAGEETVGVKLRRGV